MAVVIVFVVAVIIATIALRAFIRKPAILIVTAALTCAIAFQLINYLKIGYLDPFFVIALVIQTAIGLAVAGATIAIFRTVSSKNTSTRGEGS